MKKNYKKSIKIRIVLSLIVIALSVLIISEIYRYKENYAVSFQALNTLAEQIVERLAVDLAEPLALKDEDFIEQFLTKEMKDQQIYAITIFDSNHVGVGKSRDSNWRSSSQTNINNPDRYILLNKNIIWLNRKVGSVNLYITKYFMERNIKEATLKKMSISLMMTILIIIFLVLLLNKIVIHPIEKLVNKIKTVSQGQYGDDIEFFRDDEIGILYKEFNEMRRNVLLREKQLLDSQSQVRLLLDSAAEAIYGIDLEGNCTFVNRSCLNMLGYQNSSEMIGKNMHQMIHYHYPDGSNYPIKDCRIYQAINNNQCSHVDDEVLWRKDASCFPVEYWSHPIIKNSRCVGAVVTFLDISERLTIHQALKNSEQEQRDLLNFMLNAVISIDGKGIVLSFNNAAEKLFGYSSKEIIGQNVKRLMPEPFTSEHHGYLEKCLQKNKPLAFGSGREVQGLTKNKVVFPMWLLIAELPETVQGQRRFIGSCVDLTQIKRQEEQLRRGQKINAIAKLVSGMAHDYNNMFGVTLGYSELLKNKLSGQLPLADYAKHIHSASIRGAKLTEKLLSLANEKPSEADLQVINQVLNEQQGILQKTLTVQIKLIMQLEDNLWSAWINRNDLENAILNLCINSMESIQKIEDKAQFGSLNIVTRNLKLNTIDMQDLGLSVSDCVAVSFKDNGKGMDEETKEKIFDPFFSTKEESGSGLGLAQVFNFVEKANGAIHVDSEIDQGSCFTLYFPRYVASNEVKTTPKIEEISVRAKTLLEPSNMCLSGSEAILIVDDEECLRDLCYDLLSDQGYQVICADSSQQALHYLKQQSFDLMLVDVIMPEMNGYQLSIVVQEQYPSIKIQLASGFSNTAEQFIGDADLRPHLLQKPYRPKTLLRSIRSLLDGDY